MASNEFLIFGEEPLMFHTRRPQMLSAVPDTLQLAAARTAALDGAATGTSPRREDGELCFGGQTTLTALATPTSV
jgi:hypothetical protein